MRLTRPGCCTERATPPPRQQSSVSGRWKPDARHPALNVFAPWAAGTGSPSASPYSVGLRGSHDDPGNGIVGESVVSGRWKPDAWHPALNVFALWAAGTGSPSASPYSVGVRGSSRRFWERDCRGIRFRDRCYPLRSPPGDPSMKTVVPPPSDPDAVGAGRSHAHPGLRFSPFKKDLDKNPGPFLRPLTTDSAAARAAAPHLLSKNALYAR